MRAQIAAEPSGRIKHQSGLPQTGQVLRLVTLSQSLIAIVTLAPFDKRKRRHPRRDAASTSHASGYFARAITLNKDDHRTSLVLCATSV
jgi:hypothetical protein